MEVNCVFFGPMRDVVGRKSITVQLAEGATVAEAFDSLCASYDELEAYLADDDSSGHRVTTTVDRTNVAQLNGLETRLTDGAVLRLAPPIVGGRR